MPARAVVLPATPLLVPGAGGGVDRLAEVRRAVGDALDRLLRGPGLGADGDGPLVVLAPVPRGAAGRTARLRPSLAGAGVRDGWVPDVAAWPASDLPAAHVPASVALVALRAALDRAAPGRAENPAPAPDILVVEAAGGETVTADGAAALGAARGIVVAGGPAPGTPGATAGATTEGRPDLDPAVAAALDEVAAPGAWTWRVTAVPGGHEHLPGAYVVATGVAGP